MFLTSDVSKDRRFPSSMFSNCEVDTRWTVNTSGHEHTDRHTQPFSYVNLLDPACSALLALGDHCMKLDYTEDVCPQTER